MTSPDLSDATLDAFDIELRIGRSSYDGYATLRNRCIKAADAIAALRAKVESLRAECGLRQIKGYHQGIARATAAPTSEEAEQVITWLHHISGHGGVVAEAVAMIRQQAREIARLNEALDMVADEREAFASRSAQEQQRANRAEQERDAYKADAERLALLKECRDEEALDHLAAAADIIAFQHQIPVDTIARLAQVHEGWIVLIDAARQAATATADSPRK